jgi:cytochrome P450
VPDLKHIPGDDGLPIIGHTHHMLRDAEAFALEGADLYGPIYRTNFLFRPTVVVGTAEGARQILLDRERVFSSEAGWEPYIGQLFRRGLMLRDFDDHRFHRRIMQEAFRSDALSGDVAAMQPVIDDRLAALEPGSTPDLYAFYKQLTLEIAATVFVGAELGGEVDRLNRAFVDAVAAAVAPIRAPLPFTAFRRGMRGRAELEAYFSSQIPARRRSPASDLFTRLCHATDEDGAAFTDDEIVDHMIFLLMAAHDTTTSTLASMSWYLAGDDGWQDRLREEACSAGTFTYDRRDDVPAIDLAFREAMRLHPPVPFIPRRVLADTVVDEVPIPAGTQISLASLLVHRDPSIWTQPERFDPGRFASDRAEHKAHSHAWFPFSGGAHTCIGMHFAGLMTKAIMVSLLSRFALARPPGRQVRFQTMPIPKPVGGLPLELVDR